MPPHSLTCGTALLRVRAGSRPLLYGSDLLEAGVRPRVSGGRLAGMRQALALEPEAPIGMMPDRGSDPCRDARGGLRPHLGTGGPADWLRVFVEHGDLNRVEYHYADWGTHERVELTPDEEATLLAWINRFARVWE